MVDETDGVCDLRLACVAGGCIRAMADDLREAQRSIEQPYTLRPKGGIVEVVFMSVYTMPTFWVEEVTSSLEVL